MGLHRPASRGRPVVAPRSFLFVIIGIIGAGKIGITIAALLESSEFCSGIVIGDKRADVPLPRSGKSSYKRLDVRRPAQLEAFLRGCDASVSAAPFFLNKTIATACAKRGVAYFDLTEDVETTEFVRGLARKAKSTFMPQCGLALIRPRNFSNDVLGLEQHRTQIHRAVRA